jgi:hypothetical protein
MVLYFHILRIVLLRVTCQILIVFYFYAAFLSSHLPFQFT